MALLDQLKDLVNQIDNKNCCSTCPAPACVLPCCDPPYVQCCMTIPPPIVAPTAPKTTKPLQLPCPENSNKNQQMSQEEAERTRYANYYNNYNIDWHPDPTKIKTKQPVYYKSNKGKYCEDYTEPTNTNRRPQKAPGCPTGFKPCKMELAPLCGDVWTAKLHVCSPKPRKKYSCFYVPERCNRPGCKHWAPKEGVCKYDKPCKAHCYNHPIGIKPSGRSC